MERTKELRKLIRMTGDRAKLDAKANDSYVVYKSETGSLIKEYANGSKVTLTPEGHNNNV